MRQKAGLMRCELCKRNSPLRTTKLCDACDLSIFQINTILSLYLESESPPQWLTNGLIEIASWAYIGNPHGSGYFNTANECVEIFAIDRHETIPISDLEEINYTNLPANKVLQILKNALIIDYNTENILPGPISKKLIQIRWDGYEMNSPEVKSKIKEIQGIIAVAVTKSLLQNAHKPQKALGLFKLMAKIILDSNISGNISPYISDYDLDIALNKIPSRQQNKIVRQIVGLGDGETKIITDKDIEGKMPLKEDVKVYLENMRERYRERERSDRGYMAWW
jgi:hypothetical protein